LIVLLEACAPAPKPMVAQAVPAVLEHGTVLAVRPVVVSEKLLQMLGEPPPQTAAPALVEIIVHVDGGRIISVVQENPDALSPGRDVAIIQGEPTRLKPGA
jgi:outer membrane lipoprotein SlyB